MDYKDKFLLFYFGMVGIWIYCVKDLRVTITDTKDNKKKE
jgi:hypothetical protein